MYTVIRAFDHYAAGDVLSAEAEADQQKRGNLPDLLANGYLAKSEPPKAAKKPTRKPRIKKA